MNDRRTLANLRFKLECGEITLTNDGETSLVIKGPGQLWQELDGQVSFKIFTNSKGYRDLLSHYRQPGVTGELVSDAAYFSLEAREFDGPSWHAPRVLPNVRGGFSEGLAWGKLGN